jgi:hypothetical protein
VENNGYVVFKGNIQRSAGNRMVDGGFARPAYTPLSTADFWTDVFKDEVNSFPPPQIFAGMEDRKKCIFRYLCNFFSKISSNIFVEAHL